ncbi:MAG: FKBP-type peptidyl-prolyl cis-trans isomerase [Bacteroidales bacterium]
MKNTIIILLPLSLLMSSFSCQRNNQPEKKEMSEIKEEYKVPMMDWNKRKVTDQDMQIKGYADRRNWNMTRTGTGMYYEIYEQGTGTEADTGQYAIIKYELHLLDGTFCYSSDSTGPKKLKLGRVELESGLEEALFKMHKGDKARIIVPPHLAYGLPGDGDKIPADAILVYNVELIDLQ